MTDLTRTVCISCGIEYALPTVLYDQQRKHGGYHHCPNGHSQGWSKDASEFEQMRRERDRLKQDAARLEDENRAAWVEASEQAERAAKAEAETKRVKKRATAALCPCCNRSFSQLARHMKTKHPEIVNLPARKASEEMRA